MFLSVRASTSKAWVAWVACASLLAMTTFLGRGAAGADAHVAKAITAKPASMASGATGVGGASPAPSIADAGSAPLAAEMGRIASARQRALVAGGVARTYLVQPVAASSGPGPFPIVVLLHGGTQTAEDVWAQTSLPILGERASFIVVAPQGLARHWNDARGSTLNGEPASTADDVGFLRAVIADVVARDHGDSSAVFMAGVSNGGFMTMRFACDAGDVLRAAASLLANLPEAMKRDCRSPRPLPWLAVNGTDDPLIPFAGQPEGTAARRGNPQPALLSADDTFRFWADRDGCTAPLAHRALTDPAKDERHRWAESVERGGCAGNQVSRQVVLHGSGHVAPGLPVRLALVERIVGPAAPELDGGTLVWQFFRETLMK